MSFVCDDQPAVLGSNLYVVIWIQTPAKKLINMQVSFSFKTCFIANVEIPTNERRLIVRLIRILQTSLAVIYNPDRCQKMPMNDE